MKRYRIAHVLPFPGVGGTEIGTLRAAQAAEGPLFENVIYCREDAPAVAALFRDAGFTTATWSPVEPSYRRPGRYVANSWKLARDLRKRNIDLVHCADYLSGHYAGLAAWMARVPTLCHVRNRLSTLSKRDQSFLRLIDRFVFVSRQTWREFAYPVPESRGVVLYDGIDVQPRQEAERTALRSEIREKLGLAAAAPLIVMASRVAPQKDYATLIRAAAQVTAKRPDVHFAVIGDYEHTRDHYEQVMAAVKEHQLERALTFTGFRPDVRRFMAAADAFVLSTHYEGNPLVLLEAMAEEAPVVATAVSGIPEVIDDGASGFLFPHEDAAVLAGHVLALLGDPEQARQMGRAGRETVETRFTTERYRANLRAIYASMLKLG